MPVFGGRAAKTSVNASNPPADAPMPTMGKLAALGRLSSSSVVLGTPGAALRSAGPAAAGISPWPSNVLDNRSS